MADQPVPKVNDEDVRRIVRRDFGEQNEERAFSVLCQYDPHASSQSAARVKLAILKLAAGNLKRLEQQTRDAILDFRDVLVAAEYPRYGREIFTDSTEGQAHRVIDADWKQYDEWLRRR